MMAMSVVAVLMSRMIVVVRLGRHRLILRARISYASGARCGGGDALACECSGLDLSRAPVIVLRQPRRLRFCRIADVAREQVRDVGASDADIGKRAVVERAQLVVSGLPAPPALIGEPEMLQSGKNEVQHF